MALTKQTTINLLLNAPNAAFLTSTSAAEVVLYGCSLLATITNGVTGPTLPCSATLEVSPDGINYLSTGDVRTAGTTGGLSYSFGFNLGVGGLAAGDWYFARIHFGGNTDQPVNCMVVGVSTSAI